MARKRHGEAKRILRAEMIRRGVSYEALAAGLAELGVSNGSLRTKMSRGSFTADFFLQCLTAMRIKKLRLED
jgi:hypothetical protein